MSPSSSRIVLGLASVLALSLPLLVAVPRARSPISIDVPTAEAQSVWKDLKVLPSTISKAELKSIMKQQSKELGVDCEHCHPKVASPEEPNSNKTAAREMMQMTAAISANYQLTQKKVTCWSCHRGKAHPDEMPSKPKVANPKDPSPGKIATREMTEMTAAIKATYKQTQKKVTCWSCHRGKAHPDEMPK